MGRASGQTLGERFRLALVAVGVALLLIVVTGPLRSGAIFLLLPTFARHVDHDLPPSYKPLHKGHVDVRAGLYIREDEDLVVRGTPPLILRRIYRSGDHERRQFGIGTTHNGEMLVFSNSPRLQQASLSLGDVRVDFDRTTSGTSISNAMFEQRNAGDEEWLGARLGWTGFNWALRRPDGGLMVFRQCGPGVDGDCSIEKWRDADGHLIEFERDFSGILLKIVADDRWISFAYDRQRRISRAWSSGGSEVRYKYDGAGRLIEAAESSGAVHRYSYTTSDLLATMQEPDTTIENTYENERCIRQVNRFPDTPVPYVFEFSYTMNGNAVVQTDSHQSDGTWKRYTFDATSAATSEIWGADGASVVTIEYQRDPVSRLVTSLTVTCPDRSGHLLSHSSAATRGEEWTKWDLLRTHCAPQGYFHREP